MQECSLTPFSLLSPISVTVPLPRTILSEVKSRLCADVVLDEGKPYHPNTVVCLDAVSVSAVTWPQIYYFTDEQQLSIQGQYYCVSSCKNQQCLYSRNSQGELLSCLASKTAKGLAVCTIERCIGMYHLNTVFIEQTKHTSHDYYISMSTQFCDMKEINGGRQLVIVGKEISCYVVMLFDFHSNCIVKSVELYIDREFNRYPERFVKFLKSEYGDVLYLSTNKELYEVEIESEVWNMSVKPLNLWKRIEAIRTKKEVQYPYHESIEDVQFIPNSLKIIILTSLQELFIIEAQNCLFECDFMNEVKRHFSKNEEWKSLMIHSIYTINEFIVLTYEEEKNNMGLIVLKMKPKGTYVRNIIELPFSRQDLQTLYFENGVLGDEIYVQYILKRTSSVFYINKYKLTTANNTSQEHFQEHQFVGSERGEENDSLFHPCPKMTPIKKCHVCPTTKTIFQLREKQLVCYRLPTQDIAKTHLLFTQSFFEQPLRIAVSPCTNHFIIVFKQLVRFFSFHYTCCKTDFSLKSKNVGAVSYSPSGRHFLLCTADNKVHLFNAFSYSSCVVGEVSGEVIEAYLPDEQKVVLRGHRQITVLWCRRRAEIRVEEGDQCGVSGEEVVVVRGNSIVEVYGMDGELRVRRCLRVREEEIRGVEVSTTYGIMLLYTKGGGVRQCLWPVEESGDPMQEYGQSVCERGIVAVAFSCDMSQFYAVSEDGVVVICQCRQYLRGQLMRGVYGVVRKEERETLWESMDRFCLLSTITPLSLEIKKELGEQVLELQFMRDKIGGDKMGGDIEQLQRMHEDREREGIERVKMDHKIIDMDNAVRDADQQEKRKAQYERVVHQINNNGESRDKALEIEREQYKEKILKIYIEGERLQKILDSKKRQLDREKEQLQRIHSEGYRTLWAEGQLQMYRLQKEYESAVELQEDMLDEMEQLGECKSIDRSERLKQMKLTLQAKLQAEESLRYETLARNNQLEKENADFFKRADKFQNSIMETRLEISKRKQESEDYAQMKAQLADRLVTISYRISNLESEMIVYLRSIEARKTAKMTHEFELQEYQQQVLPAESQYVSLEDNIRRMNSEIMGVYEKKVAGIAALKEAQEALKQYKEQKQQLIIRSTITKTRLNRVVEAVSAFDVFESKDTSSLLQQLVKKIEARSEGLAESAEEEEMKRLLRKKAFIKKELQLEEKNEDQIKRNQHQLYKYHVENTELVREVNELRKANGELTMEQEVLLRKIASMGESGERRRTRSIQLPHTRSACKLTPFQKHEMQKQTPQTKTSVGGQSAQLLHGLLSDIKASKNPLNKMDIIRDRVRTFVNPQIKPKQLFRSRVSDKLKL